MSIEIIPLVDERVIRENLTRMGIFNTKSRILYPSCYLFKIDERYFIRHFKEILNEYNNEDTTLQETDQNRLNSIVFCLQCWNLVRPLDSIIPHDKHIFVLPFEQKNTVKIYHKIHLNNK